MARTKNTCNSMPAIQVATAMMCRALSKRYVMRRAT